MPKRHRMLIGACNLNAAPAAPRPSGLAFEAGRRSGPLNGTVVTVSSATRMPFEQNGVLWTINFTNPSSKDAAIKVDFELGAAIAKFASASPILSCFGNEVIFLLCLPPPCPPRRAHPGTAECRQ